MSRWRVLVVLGLIVAPFLFLTALGSLYLWDRGLAFYVWWPMAACMALGYLLGHHWQRKQRLLRPVDANPPMHWTDRDRQAWRLVEARGKATAKISAERLSSVDFYVDTAKEMANELTGFYHPGSQDPVAVLTIPEILAVVELASHDLAEMVDEYLPGGHLLTIRDWRRARQATEWYATASNVYWAVSAVFSPINTALRFVASQVGLSRPLQMLQQNLLVWFGTAYVHRLGTYLIDLNSGRLRVGARRFRELMTASKAADGEVVADAVDDVRKVTVTLCGQVKAGKSSLINAILGEQRAVTDVLPATNEVARYELQPQGVPTRLVLLDTVGYGHAGPKADQLRATQDAAKQSDLLLLVLHARNPARQADVNLLQQLRTWFLANPDLRMPPVVAVLTHIDLLSPAMEWSPPYDWQTPEKTKEKQIAEAVTATQEQLGEHLAAVVPLCGAEGKVYGVDEFLLPVVAELLDEVHAVALLRCLKAEIDTGKVRKVFRQLLAAGKQMVNVLWNKEGATGGRERSTGHPK